MAPMEPVGSSSQRLCQVAPGVGGLEHSATHSANIKGGRLGGDAGKSASAAGAHGTDLSPAHGGVETGGHGLSGRLSCGDASADKREQDGKCGGTAGEGHDGS